MVYPHRLVLVGMLPFRNEIYLLMEAQQCQFAVAYLGPFLAGGADDAAGKMRYADSGIGRVHMLPPPGPGAEPPGTPRQRPTIPASSTLPLWSSFSSSMFFLLCRDRHRDAELRPRAGGLAGGREGGGGLEQVAVRAGAGKFQD